MPFRVFSKTAKNISAQTDPIIVISEKKEDAGVELAANVFFGFVHELIRTSQVLLEKN